MRSPCYQCDEHPQNLQSWIKLRPLTGHVCDGRLLHVRVRPTRAHLRFLAFAHEGTPRNAQQLQHARASATDPRHAYDEKAVGNH